MWFAGLRGLKRTAIQEDGLSKGYVGSGRPSHILRSTHGPVQLNPWRADRQLDNYSRHFQNDLNNHLRADVG